MILYNFHTVLVTFHFMLFILYINACLQCFVVYIYSYILYFVFGFVCNEEHVQPAKGYTGIMEVCK